MCQKIVLPVVGIPLFAYGAMILLGFITACLLAQREAERHGIKRERILDFSVLVVLAGVVGSRLFYVIQFYDEHFRYAPWYEVFAIWKGGLVFYGGAIGAFAAGWWYLKRHKLPALKILDVCIPFVPIGMGFGRIGCFLNGCCWGSRCTAAFPAFLSRFPPGSPVNVDQLEHGFIREGQRTLPVHPWELYDSFHSFVLFGLLWWYARSGPPRGAVTSLFLTLYAIGRFFLDGLRGDHRPTFTGLTVSQNISVVVFAVGVAGLVVSHLRAAKAEKGAEPSPAAETA